MKSHPRNSHKACHKAPQQMICLSLSLSRSFLRFQECLKTFCVSVFLLLFCFKLCSFYCYDSSQCWTNFFIVLPHVTTLYKIIRFKNADYQTSWDVIFTQVWGSCWMNKVEFLESELHVQFYLGLLVFKHVLKCKKNKMMLPKNFEHPCISYFLLG